MLGEAGSISLVAMWGRVPSFQALTQSPFEIDPFSGESQANPIYCGLSTCFGYFTQIIHNLEMSKMEVGGIYKKKFLSPSLPSQFNFSSAVSDKVFKLRKQGKSQEEESKVTHCTGLRRSNPCSAAKYYNLQLHNCFQGKLLQGTPRHFAGNRKN